MIVVMDEAAPAKRPGYWCPRASPASRRRQWTSDVSGTGDQSSFRIVPVPRFLPNSELLLLPNRSR